MSSPSSSTDYIALLNLVQKRLYQVGGPILIVIGSISCVLSLIVFNKKNLRKNPCSIYLMAFHVTSFLQIYTTLLFITLSIGFNISPSAYNLSFCRFSLYIALLGQVLAPFYLILASVDRILITSRNALTRQRSTRRFAYISIISVTLFWTLFHTHALIFSTIIQIAPNYFTCYFSPGVYLTVEAYYSLIVRSILIPLLMVVLGLWTLKNIRSIVPGRVTTVSPTSNTEVVGNLRSGHSKNRQLARILLIDIGVYIICNLTLSIVLMYQQITQYNTKSVLQNQIDNFVRYLATIIAYIPYCISCYTHLIGSKTFRNEIKGILVCR